MRPSPGESRDLRRFESCFGSIEAVRVACVPTRRWAPAVSARFEAKPRSRSPLTICDHGTTTEVDPDRSTQWPRVGDETRRTRASRRRSASRRGRRAAASTAPAGTPRCRRACARRDRHERDGSLSRRPALPGARRREGRGAAEQLASGRYAETEVEQAAARIQQLPPLHCGRLHRDPATVALHHSLGDCNNNTAVRRAASRVALLPAVPFCNS